MKLPLAKTYAPMEAQPAECLPEGPNWHYEPKWDGFRCLAFRQEKDVYLESKSGKPLTRYFPELVASLRKIRADYFVLDGEIVIPVDGKLSFDDLLLRIHPAPSRIETLSKSIPCLFIVFDLLVDQKGKKIVNLPLRERRRVLDAFARQSFAKNGRIRLSPAAKQLGVAKKWFHSGVGLDGVIAKRED
jgi:ATP-dependent DNA ligase